MKNFTLLLTLLLISITQYVSGQSYAVTSSVQIPSYSSYLSDYSNPNSMFVTLLSTDVRPVYTVRVKVEISGQGYTIKSKTGSAGGQFLQLPRNQPVTLTGSGLQEMFDPDKLDFIGISKTEFLAQGGVLPGGPVTFCITANDIFLDKAVSNVSCALGNIQSNTPPQIISPTGEQEPTNPQQMIFSWLPQHIGAFPVLYDLEIYELNSDVGYNVIVESTAPVFTVTSSITSYNYSSLDPALVEGQEYIFRVRVRDIAGQQIFENNGWSEIGYFSYGSPGIAACYQWTASFCAPGCEFTYGTLVCDKTSYEAMVKNTPGAMEAWLNSLGIGNFTVAETQVGPDEYGYCSIEVVISATELTDAPLSLNILSPGFSDHCAPQPAGNSSNTPGFEEPANPEPNIVGQELSFFFGPCEDSPDEAYCNAPEDSSLEIIAEHPVMAQLLWGDVAEQNTSAFQIEYRLVGDSSWVLVDSIPGDSLNGFMGDLHGGLLYEARVRAVCANELISDWTSAVEFNTTCIIPNVAWVSDLSHNSVELEWAPLNYATQFELVYRRVGTEKWLSKSTTESFVEIKQLFPNTTYEYKLRVLCSDEWGGFTSTYEFTTDRICEGNTIDNEQVSNITFQSARLDWTDTADEPSGQYSVRYREIGDEVWQVGFTETAGFDFQFLESNTWYQFNISKHCSDIWSDWTMTGSFQTACAPPASTWAENITPKTAALKCTPDSGVRYEFSFKERFSQDWIVKNMTTPYLNVINLQDNTEYEFKVRVQCEEGEPWSAFTAASYFTTEIRCDSPEIYEVTELTPFSAFVEWENAVRPVKWGIYYRRADGTPMIGGAVVGATGKVTSSTTEDGWVYQVCLTPELLIESLVPDKVYEFKVESWCEAFGWTVDSEIYEFRTLTNCRVPVGIQAAFVGTDTAAIIWEMQLYDKQYQVQLRQKNTVDWQGFNAPTNEMSFSDLQSNVTYEYQVRTNCDNFGWTDWSEILEFRTDECLPPSDVTKEYMATDASIVVSWQASAGENLYQLEYRQQDSINPPEWIKMETGNNHLEIVELQTDKIYEYRVAENCLSAGLLYNDQIDTFLLGRPSLNTEYFECGLPVTPFDADNFYPLDYLNVGDSITASDFGVIITQVNGSVGTFSGRGYIPVPYFNRARVNVKFSQIKVNDEYRLVNGKIKVTGVGFQVISEETAALLDNIVDGLETLDDLLAQAEEILEIIDEIIETLAPYLPSDVIQGLEDAKEAVITAQESGNSADLEAAQTALQTANQNFQTAMTELLTRVLNIIMESLNQLDQEFSGQADQIISDYETATDNLEEFDQTYNGIYATSALDHSESAPDFSDFEWEEENLTDQQEDLAANNENMNSLITLSGDYYEKVFAYGQMKGVQELKNQIQTNADLVPFLSALMNKEINLLDFIGSKIADGKSDEEIIPDVKVDILTGIDKILRQL